ncbi:MAG: hypothetical protein M3R55_17230, partial [Acidobacteriota bacterium]|nr:hypothetical protein [Acidobacteriota bacterium]
HEALAFFAGVRDVPVFTPYESVALWRDDDPIVSSGRLRDPIAVMTYNGFQRGQAAHLELFVVTQRRILEQLAALDPSHLILAGRSHYLVPYLDRTSWARRVFEESSVLIYELDPVDQRPPVPEVEAAPVLYFRSGDGSRAEVTLTDRFERYELPGQGVEEDNIFFYLDRRATAFIDDVAFEIPEGRAWRNLLAGDDAAFEGGVGNWAAAGSQQIAPAEGEGRHGGTALRLSSSEPGGAQSIITLTNPFFEFSGGRNRFVFWARAPLPRWLCVNDALPGDVAWLTSAHPE